MRFRSQYCYASEIMSVLNGLDNRDRVVAIIDAPEVGPRIVQIIIERSS